ncbi:extracellular solute-binding protein [Cohnella lupini]|uniref:Carbohydrate ABC transporter substrate-binding protein (CUT1 family) n=1 Tax=Cohnella lupini TaxID=1294267 RepID=A0A3D9ITB9_9BACL|nr:extracellular solute-binding protein [Cohnella lupini]RED64759.1 carbohydrate ABC transporter substrate-binding protein (CUT1 family) [Cohnella lupini]
MIKAFSAASAAMLLTVSLLSACSDNNSSSSTEAGEATPKSGTENAEQVSKSGFPIANEPISLSAMVLLSPAQPTEWNDIAVWQEYEKMTGIHIDWDEYTTADITEKRNLALASNELPDIFYRTKMPDSDVDKYGAQGSFLKLNDLIDQYAPNFKAVMEKYPDVKKGIATADGSIYALPNLTDSPSIEITKKLFLNQDWLKRTGKKLPTTTDELYEVLKAFRNDDPNGNGKTDEIPLTADSLDDIMLVLKGAFGLGNKGTGNGNWDVDPDSGKLRFFPTSESYKELLTYLHKLYSENLIDQEIFTNSGTNVLAKNEQNMVGSFSFANIVARANTNAKDFVGLDTALSGPNGDHLFTSARGHFGSKGAFMISSTNKHPEATMRWIDYFYGEEGTRMLYLGLEGQTYQKDASGNYDFIPEIVSNIPEGSSFDQVVSKYVPYAGGSLPTLLLEKYFKGGETEPAAKAAAEKLGPSLPEELWAPFSFTSEESKEKLSLEADIYGYVSQRTAEFVQGKASLDEFDKYVEWLEKMGLNDLQSIYETAYSRYTTK